jgi:hypothetical protein
MWIVKNSGWYRQDGTDQVYATKEEAHRVSRGLNMMRGRTWVERLEE